MFLEESMENLQTLNEALLNLEQSPNDIDMVNQIFRVAHTIKGMAATMGFNNIAELTHKMEDVLSNFREGKLKVTENVVTVLFNCLDTLERMVSNIEEGIEEEVDIEPIMKSLGSIVDGVSMNVALDIVEEANENSCEDVKVELNQYDISIVRQAINSGFNTLNIHIWLNEDTLLKSARAFLILQELEAQGEILKANPSVEDIESENFDVEIYFLLVTKKSQEEIESIVKNISEVAKVLVSKIEIELPVEEEQPVVKQDTINEKEIVVKKHDEPKKEKQGKKSHQSVRVDLQRIDTLMNMVSELVIYRTRLEQIVINNKSPELAETLEQVERTTSDLQDLVMKIRMLPLDIVFNRFPRMMRDLSVELGKDINFIIEGADTELDRTVIDEIGEPLIHLLRNSADHGIETKEARIAAGKPPQGTVKLIAYQEGTKALIEVCDDGAGINVEKVKAKAEKVGISTSGLSEQEIKELIFHQGFSTNEVVTDVSGRGVGMDVVKTKIEALGGVVDLVSEPGKGSRFIVTLPLTLQIIQALLVKVGKETFAISLGFIDRVIEYRSENVKHTNGEEVIVYRDKIIPLIRLNEKLRIDADNDGKKYVIIVKIGNKLKGLLVDSLLGQQEIVIKPLGKIFKDTKEYIGATILGDGLVTLILDVGAIV
jgi:two-component system chemotaxis sensor kinase CheA